MDANFIQRKAQPNCPSCGQTGTRIYEAATDYYFRSPGEWSLSRCDHNCGTAWLDPTPLPEDIGKAYANYHTHQSAKKPNNRFSKLLGKLAHARLMLHPDYRGMQSERRAGKYLYLDKLSPGRVLDIGCGGGRFLNRMQKIGWEVEGVDFDAEATKRVRSKYGFPVHTGDVRELQLPEGSYDAIVMSHAVEHVADPVAMMAECKRLLRDGGRLVIITPNINCIARRRFGVYWRGLEVPRHIQIFSRKGLRHLLEKAGLAVERLSTFSHESEGIYQVSEEMLNSDQGQHRQPLETAYKAKISAIAESRYVQKNGDIGEDIFAVAIKK